MQPLCYHVAVTLDGLIARPDGSAPGFVTAGSHVDAYQRRLAEYAAIVMGRATYEIGYTYGMKPGDLPYGERPHHVFSNTLDLPARPHLHVVGGDTLEAIDRIKSDAPGPVYFCGGGKLGGFLLKHRKIDILRLKLAPLVYGQGIRLFEDADGVEHWQLTDSERFDTGHMLLEYRLR